MIRRIKTLYDKVIGHKYDEIYTFTRSADNVTTDLVKLLHAGNVVAVTYFTEGALGATEGIDVIDGGADASGTAVIDSCSDNLDGKDHNVVTPYAMLAGEWLRVKVDDLGSAIGVTVVIVYRVKISAVT